MKINLILALNKKNVLGDKNTIPWKEKEDLKLFKNLTTDNVVIMGRKTWESLGMLYLPNRVNIVVSSNYKEIRKKLKREKLKDSTIGSSMMDYPDRTFDIKLDDPGPFIEPDFKSALVLAQNAASLLHRDVFVIGGLQVYLEALKSNIIDSIYLSHINNDLDGDTKLDISEYLSNFDLKCSTVYTNFIFQEWNRKVS